MCTEPTHREHSIAEVPHLRHLEAKVSEGVDEPLKSVPNRLSPSKGRRFPFQRRLDPGMPLRFWVELLQQRVKVSVVERLESAPESLDVLLRHRPRSIPRQGQPGQDAGKH